MPDLIRHIDHIARLKGRDVLYVRFHHSVRERPDWERLPVRSMLIAWLDANNYAWTCCGHVGSTELIGPYLGQLYIDVPFDEVDPAYRRLRDFLEKPDGSMVFDDALFCYYPLDEAIKNAHHDAPEFWDNWAASF